MKILAMLFPLVFLFGCSGATEFVNQAPSTPAVSKRDIFLDVVHQEAPATRNIPDAQIVRLAHLVCRAMDNGATFEELSVAMLNEGINANMTGTLIGASIAWKCPEYRSTI